MRNPGFGRTVRTGRRGQGLGKRAVLAAAALAVLSPGLVHAASVSSTWSGGDGLWSDKTKWQPSTNYPSNLGPTTYDASINNGAAVTLDRSITIQKFALSSGTLAAPASGSYNLTANELFTWSGGTLTGAGTITPKAGLDLSNTLALAGGRAINSTGTITWRSGASLSVSGPNSRWTQNGTLPLNSGALTINQSGSVFTTQTWVGDQAGSSATVTLDGAGSQLSASDLLIVGSYGSGTISVANGASVSAYAASIADKAGGSGSATVSGATSSWTTTDYLSVGDSSTGTFSVLSGAQVNTDWTIIGANADGNGTLSVKGSGSVLRTETTYGYINVADAGVGRLEILQAGQVVSNWAPLASQPGGQATVLVDGANSKWTSASISIGELGTANFTLTNRGKIVLSELLVVGEKSGANGTLTISAGGEAQVDQTSIGETAGSTGSLTVTGSTSKLTTPTFLLVGDYGQGTMTVSGGALVSSHEGIIAEGIGGSGNATVTGAGSRWLNSSYIAVGSQGDGALTISAGGLVTAAEWSDVGSWEGATGQMTVTGANSKFDCAQQLFVGNGGQGTLLIADGGVVQSRTAGLDVSSGAVGTMAGGVGDLTITGSGSKWDQNGEMIVGWEGQGTMRLEAGGALNSASGHLGRFGTASGSATITGSGSKWTNTGLLIVGDAGTGSLSISDGGLASNTDAYVAAVAGSTGSVAVQGAASWTSSGSVHIGGSNTGAGGSGSLAISAGGMVSVGGTLSVWDGGSVNLTGGTLTASHIVNRGTLAIGTAAKNGATLSVSGSFTNLAGTATIAGQQNWAPGATLTNDGGTVNLDSDAGAPAALRLTVNANAPVNLNATQHLAALNIGAGGSTTLAPGGKALVTQALSIAGDSAPSGTLELNDGVLILRAPADIPAALSLIEQQIRAARDGGAAGLWSGSGITSHEAQANDMLGLAAFANTRAGRPIFDTVTGETAEAGDVLVMLALNGDTDLNGMIDASDYFRLARGAAKSLGSWINGDFDYSGAVDNSDLALIDRAFLAQHAPQSATRARLAATAVPEPGALALLALGALTLAARRRRPSTP